MYDDIDNVCTALDEVSLSLLELMQEKISAALQIEELLRTGYIELAKARYIRGMESIGILQVPTTADQLETLFEVHRDVDKEDDIPQFTIVQKKKNKEGENLPDPIKWFGVLVPQNLRNAQKRFQGALQLIAKCANIQSQIISTTEKLEQLRKMKSKLSEKEE